MPDPAILDMNLYPCPGETVIKIGCPYELLVHWEKDCGMDPMYAGKLKVTCSCATHGPNGNSNVVGEVDLPDMVPSDITPFNLTHGANYNGVQIRATITVDNVPNYLERTVDVDCAFAGCGMGPPPAVAAGVGAAVAAGAAAPAVAAGGAAVGALAIDLVSLNTPAPGYAVFTPGRPAGLNGKFIAAAGDAVSLALLKADGTFVAEFLATLRPGPAPYKLWGVAIPEAVLARACESRPTVRLTLWKAGAIVDTKHFFTLILCPRA